MAVAYTTPTQQDALLSVSIALPNAANTVNSNVIDLGAVKPFPTTGRFTVQMTSTVGTGANSKNINYALQHSAESNANFTNISELAIQVVAGNAANSGALSANFALPPSAKQYIRGTATGEANGGNSADGTLTVKLLF